MATKRSYELKFGINDSEVAQQLENIDKSLRETQGEAKLLKTALSQGWDASKWVQAKQNAVKTVEEMEKKIQLLRARLKEMEQDGSAESNAKQFKELQKEILATENAAAKARGELAKINNLHLDNVKKQLQEAQKELDSIGKTLSIGVTAPLTAAGAASVKTYSDMHESLGKVRTVFDDAAGSVEQFADNTLNAYGIAKSTALDMAAGFGDLATSFEIPKKEAAEMSKELVALAGDLASFKNMDLSSVQTALTAIFTGNATAAKSLGVILTEANLKEFALQQGIKKTIDDMTQAEKVQLRYRYVLQATANAHGDFARTSDSTANQMRILTESTKELASVAGEELAPIVTPIITRLGDIIKHLSQLDEGTKQTITRVALFAATLGPMVSLSGKLTGGIASVITMLTRYRAAAATGATATQALGAAMNTTPWGALATVIGVVVAALGSYAIASSLTADSTDTLAGKVRKVKEEYDSAITSIDKSVSAKNAEVAVAEKLLERYDALNGKVGDDAAKKRELASVVEQLNSKLDAGISVINEETGRYSASTEEIRKNIQARKDLIEAEAYAQKATETQKALIDLEKEFDYISVEDAQKRIKEIDRAQEYTAGSSVVDWFLDLFQSDEQKFRTVAPEMVAERDALRQYIEQREKLEKEIEDLLGRSLTGTPASDSTAAKTGGKTGSASLTDDQLKTAQEKALKDIEWLYKSGQLTEQQYLQRLTAYRDKWLTKGSEDWRTQTIKILQIQADLVKQQEKALAESQAAELAARKERQQKELNDIEWAYNSGAITQRQYLEKITAYRDRWMEEDTEDWRSYTLKITSIQKELLDQEKKAQEERVAAYKEASDAIVAAAENETNAKIKAIDEELAARNKLKEQRQQDLRLQEAMAELAFTRDADSRASLQREIKSLQEAIVERQYQDTAAMQKAQLQAEVAALRQKTVTRQEEVSAALLGAQQTAANPYMPANITVNVQGLTVEQAADMIQKAYNRIMYGG